MSLFDSSLGPPTTPLRHYKDEVLDRLAAASNVAQFVSFGPGPDPLLRYSRVRGYSANYAFSSAAEALEALFTTSPDGLVNIRSFAPDQPRSHEFIYGIQSVEDTLAAVWRIAAAGLHAIVNETIDVKDGGVSGVAYAGVLEFAPGDTPRCVEKSGTVTLPFAVGIRLLETVYGFTPALENVPNTRVEFSIHPLLRGYRGDHTVVWELEHLPTPPLKAEILWPNHTSRFLGDKAFGLLIAHVLELPVPATVVIGRHVAPFRFGRSTGTAEFWIRTCPSEQLPGRFTTRRGWADPFALMAAEDPGGKLIASVLAQEGVRSVCSGALIASSNGEITVEGVRGSGEAFMQGEAPPEPLPQECVAAVLALYGRANQVLGPTRMEWVYDGKSAWVVQLHRGAVPSAGPVLFPGQAHFYHRFEVEQGLEALRSLVDRVQGTGEGISLAGRVGITSHFGDVLRRARIPSRVEASTNS